MDADLLLDIFSTLFSLRGIDHLHCYRLLRLSVHQQPHSAAVETKRGDGLEHYSTKVTERNLVWLTKAT